MSPEVGELDETALEAALRVEPDAALVLLADLVTATDERLRGAARRLAGRLVLDRARQGRAGAGGTAKLRPVPADVGGDLDLDASADALLSALAERRPVGLDELTARAWGRPTTALCLLVDRSGSMSGPRLATAALLSAACALRAPQEHALLAFSGEVQVLRAIDGVRSAATLVDEVLALRGHGATDIAGALRAASEQLASTRASRRLTVLLSDCRVTGGDDPLPAALATQELLVLAPQDDSDEAATFARRAGARWGVLAGPASGPAALAELLA